MPIFRASTDTVACTLSDVDLKDTQTAWRKLFDAALISRDEIPGGLRLVVGEGGTAALARLVDVERDGCRWISFRLEGPVVEMTAGPAGEAALREMWKYDPPKR